MIEPRAIPLDVRAPNPVTSPVLAAFYKHWPKPAPLPDGTQPNGPGICGIEGPTGSGKTGTLFRKMWRLAQRMPVSPVDGIRHFMLNSLATTYRQLWRGPIPSLLELLPKHMGNWHGSPPDSPASHDIHARLEDGSTLHYQHNFMAIGEKYSSEEELETFFRGSPATVWHLVEADTLPPLALDFALNRSGRYPAVKHGLAPWFGVVFDLNAPRQTSWIYAKMRREWTRGKEYFVQPPAVLRDGMGGWRVNPAAENQENLPPGKYAGDAATLGDRLLRRMLAGEHMPDQRGKPVYGFYTDPETGKSEGHFDSNRHVAKAPIPVLKHAPLIFGTDGGRQPGGWFLQEDPLTGQIRVVAEILTTHGTSEERYAGMVNTMLAQPPFDGNWPRGGPGGLRDIQGGADPATFFGKDDKTGEGDWAFAFTRASGIDLRPGGGIGNKLAPRLEVITNLLRAPDVAPGVPKFIVSPTCPITIEALEGGYRYAMKRVNSEKPQFDAEPEKNDFSHLIEGGQYGLLRYLGADAAFDPSRRRMPGQSNARAAITENNEDGKLFNMNPRGQSRARAQRAG